jgi:hypothetical protein
MTLSIRNGLFKVASVVSALILLFTLGAVILTWQEYPGLIRDASRRSAGLLQSLLTAVPVPEVAPLTALCSALFSLITLILIYRSFEKTPATEILFVALFALAMAPESLRIAPALTQRFDLPGILLIMSARVLLFCRVFGTFSLFAASVYAAGLKIQKQENLIFAVIIPSLLLAMGAPIDGLSWDSSLTMINGYMVMFRVVEIAVMLITVLSFFVAAYTRGSREYVLIGAGSMLSFMGRYILVHSDTWIGPPLGLALLILGFWFLGTQLHRVYLWL